jgi:hypothetical protein
LELNQRQLKTKDEIVKIAEALGVDPIWAVSIAMVESSLGLKQRSPTGCKGVFQMSLIAMKDLLAEMENLDDDLIDMACGILFLRLLLKRHKTIDEATTHFCDPKDRLFYIKRVKDYMKEFK